MAPWPSARTTRFFIHRFCQARREGRQGRRVSWDGKCLASGCKSQRAAQVSGRNHCHQSPSRNHAVVPRVSRVKAGSPDRVDSTLGGKDWVGTWTEAREILGPHPWQQMERVETLEPSSRDLLQRLPRPVTLESARNANGQRSEI